MSISGTKLRPALVAEKGAMISPEYGVMPRPSRPHDQALGRRDQAEDADHREAAVVDFSEERLLLALGRHLLGEAEEVPQVERHRVRVALRSHQHGSCVRALQEDRVL